MGEEVVAGKENEEERFIFIQNAFHALKHGSCHVKMPYTHHAMSAMCLIGHSLNMDQVFNRYNFTSLTPGAL